MIWSYARDVVKSFLQSDRDQGVPGIRTRGSSASEAQDFRLCVRIAQGVDTQDDTKICPKCGKTFPATTEFFFRNKRGLYGLRANCKECASEHPRQHLPEHGEVRSQANRRMSVRHAEERTRDHSADQVNLLILDALPLCQHTVRRS